jgi:hypothetical protein
MNQNHIGENRRDKFTNLVYEVVEQTGLEVGATPSRGGDELIILHLVGRPHVPTQYERTITVRYYISTFLEVHDIHQGATQGAGGIFGDNQQSE